MAQKTMVARGRDVQAFNGQEERALPETDRTVGHLERVVTLEIALYLGALLLGLFLRLLLLDQRPLSVEEGSMATEAYRIVQGQPPASLLQDPLGAYGTVLALLLFGGGDGAARLLPALLGSLLVILPYLLRYSLGQRAALVAAYGMAISPVMLFASRTVGGGMVAVPLGVLLWAALEPGLKSLGRGRIYVAAILVAALIASGTEGITVLLTLGAAALVAHPRPISLLRDLRRTLVSPYGRQAALLLLATLVLLGANFGSHLAGIQWVAVDVWTTWVKAFNLSMQRGTLVLLLTLYELPVVMLGLVQLLRTLGRRQPVDSLLSVWAMLLLLFSMVHEGSLTPRLLLPLLPLYLLAARLVADTLPTARGTGIGWRWSVSSLGVVVPVAVGMILLNRASTPAAEIPQIYLYGEACLVTVGAIAALILLDGRARLALGWFAVALLSSGYLLHNSAFLNYRMETVSREPLVGTQISPFLREAAEREAYISQYFRVPVTVDPQLREALAWYMRGAIGVQFSSEPGDGVSLTLPQSDAGQLPPGSDRRPGLYTPTINSSAVTWQGAWRWAMSRDGLVRPNQRDIIVRAPAGYW